MQVEARTRFAVPSKSMIVKSDGLGADMAGTVGILEHTLTKRDDASGGAAPDERIRKRPLALQVVLAEAHLDAVADSISKSSMISWRAQVYEALAGAAPQQ